MAFAVADRVRETTTTTGTGTLNLDGAVSGFRTFVSGIGDGNVTYYAIVHRTSAEFEIGIGKKGPVALKVIRTKIVESVVKPERVEEPEEYPITKVLEKK